MSCNFPDEIGAGLTFDLLLTLTAYPAPDWAVTAHLRGPSAINLTATAEGNQHRFHADATTTSNWGPGAYWYTLRATDGTTVVEVENGEVQILPDLTSQSGPYDGSTPAQTALAAIEAVLANRASLDQERYRINNRELYRTSIADLLQLRAHYLRLVQQERAAACGKNLFGTVVRVRLN